MIKLINLICVAGAVCFGLFAFMASLIAPKESPVLTQQPYEIIDIAHKAQDTKVKVRVKLVPPPEPKIVDFKPTPLVPSEVTGNSIAIQVPGLGISTSTIATIAKGGMSDGDARPIVRIAPKYPIQAQRDGKEGWVQLAFSITKAGAVNDVRVIDSEPKRVFDKEAIRALRKWKYKAKFIDGQPIYQENLSVMLEFKMDNQSS